MKKRLRRAGATMLRLMAGLAIIAWIFSRMDLPDLRSALLESLRQWHWLAAGVGIAGVILLLGAVRWRIILVARGLELSWSRLLRIYSIGHFFNAFMLGMAGGDLARAFYTTRATGCRKTESLATVLVDRVSGMFMVYLVAGLMMAIHAEMFLGSWSLHLPALMMLGMMAAGLTGVILILNAHRFKHWPLFAKLQRRPALNRILGNLLDVFCLFQRRPALFLQTSLISLVGQLLLVGQSYCLGRALGIQLGFLDYLAVVPLIMSLAAIPVTPGGLGIREALSVTMLGAMGVTVARSLSLSLMMYCAALVWSVVGGIVFMFYSSGIGHTMLDEVAEIREEVEREAGELGITGAEYE